MSRMAIAIDGPAGAGKSTVAKAVAQQLGILYLDTGAMYRAVAWLADQHGVNVDDEAGLVQLLRTHSLSIGESSSGALAVFVDGEDVTPYLRSPEVSAKVSRVAAKPRVRQLLTQLQQEFSKEHAVVMDGRDIGTVVLPDADVKIFLTASLDERVRRRRQELEDQGFTVSHEDLARSIEERDRLDASRAVAPLCPAQDARHVDSTGRSVEEVVAEILAIVEQVVHE
ncbi:(d)CMP kinase [Alicyclobacillus kakegawensis]|uniref:(d)CMP kinase n=1 Tax=Alicyclobacillus kakegawensis TaxID=392012 RepID=UPI0008346F11|nr:(d)CMP kinase [Alicyclobacillus kakegawensis]